MIQPISSLHFRKNYLHITLSPLPRMLESFCACQPPLPPTPVGLPEEGPKAHLSVWYPSNRWKQRRCRQVAHKVSLHLRGGFKKKCTYFQMKANIRGVSSILLQLLNNQVTSLWVLYCRHCKSDDLKKSYSTRVPYSQIYEIPQFPGLSTGCMVPYTMSLCQYTSCDLNPTCEH